jgi:rhomboid family GlyGly-CTERM serine protease
MSRPSASLLPVGTLAVVVSAMLATHVPWFGQWMAYDRGMIVQGQAWRLITGHLYHYSALHLWNNLLPLVVIGAWLEKKSRVCFAAGCLLTALVVGFGLFFARPSMGRYGGLSGILCSLLAFYGFSLSVDRGTIRWIGFVTLAALILKTGYELLSGQACLIDWNRHGFVVVPLSHLFGMLAGTVWFLLQSVLAIDCSAFAAVIGLGAEGPGARRWQSNHFNPF